jgi:hypothetical protein
LTTTTSSAVWATSASTWLEITQPSNADGVEAIRGFVEDEDFGLADEGARKPKPTTHAEREPADVAVGCSGQLHGVEHLLDA